MNEIITEKCAKNATRRKKRILVSIAAFLVLTLAVILVLNPFYRHDAFGAVGVSPFLIDKITVENAENKSIIVTEKTEINSIVNQLERYQMNKSGRPIDMPNRQYKIDLYTFGKKCGSVYYLDGFHVYANGKFYDGKTDTAYFDSLF